MTVAVTGATGALGAAVARHLADRGVEQRLVVRDPSRAPRLPGATTAVATYEDTDAMARALDGVQTLFLVSGHENPDRVSLHRSAVEGARRAGVERVVYTSFMGAAPLATFPYARDHAATELAIREAGLSLTAMRSALYADVAPLFVGADGVLRAPAGNGRVAWVARRDVARLAAVLLTGEGTPRPGVRRVRAGRDRPARDGPAAGRGDRAADLLPPRDAGGGPRPRGPATPTGSWTGGSAPTWRCTPARGRSPATPSSTSPAPDRSTSPGSSRPSPRPGPTSRADPGPSRRHRHVRRVAVGAFWQTGCRCQLNLFPRPVRGQRGRG